MKRILAGLLVLAGPWFAVAAQHNAPATHDNSRLGDFVRAHVERSEAPPFSFVYNGTSSSGSLEGWAVTSGTRAGGDKTIKTVAYENHVAGLRVTATYTLFPDFPAIEWVVRFKNEGKADSLIFEDVRACSVTLADLPEGPVILYRARGSNAERSDFAPLQDVLDKPGQVRFGTSRGRSSDTAALPFFNIASPGRGIMAAIGWSGKWVAAVERKGIRDLVLEAGMKKTHFKLHPGEEVRTPSIALLFWKGADRFAGHNLFRRFVLAHHTPRLQGHPVDMPLSHGVGFGGPFPCNEYVCATESYALAMIDRLKQFGIEPEFKALRPYFYGDYYPLTEYSTSDEAWAAFQWDRPEQDDGIVLAFRRPQAVSSSITISLHNLETEAAYEVTYDDYGIAVSKSGRELSERLSIKIPEAPGSLLIKYRRVR